MNNANTTAIYCPGKTLRKGIQSSLWSNFEIPGWNIWSEIYAIQLQLQSLNKLGGFRLHIVRDLARKSEPQPVIPSPLPVSVSTNKTVEAPDSNGVVSTPSLAITEPLSSSGRIQSLLDKAADEGLVILQSRKVGFFRRSRTIKRKRAPPSCKEKQIVKEGQVLCYIEQLGCQIPIESDVSGEVIKF